MNHISRSSLFFLIVIIAGILSGPDIARGARATLGECAPLGWFPEGFGLKDHSVFEYDGFYYIASIYLPGEKKFAYGRSQDMCNWENIGPILTERTQEDWDEMAIWAPAVLEAEGVYYIYYTGVTSDFTQSIMLATSTNPTDPTAWEEQGMIFQPTHLGALWKAGYWSDCRDPHVIFANDQYYMFYTGTDVGGGIVGVASAPSPFGPWTDHGSVIPPTLGTIYESASAFYRDGTYYLTYHAMVNGVSAGTFTLISPTPDGPYTDPVHLAPGWAHEFWLSADENWYTSYLTSYTVTIAPILWPPYPQPPRPMIGDELHFLFLPVVRNP